MRRLLLTFPFLLWGCDALTPAFNADASQRVIDSYQEISELLAKAELGALQSKSTYKGEIGNYASIISQLETAKLSLQGSAPTGDETPSARANTLLISILDGCLTNVKSFSQLHQQFGITPNTGATQPVRTACDQTVKAVTARAPTLGSN